LKRVILFIGYVFLAIGMIFALVVFEINEIPGVGSIVGIALGFYLPFVWRKLIDFTDHTQWQVNLRRLLRGKVIKKTDAIRISFAYLFRIKVDGKYLLVLNGRGTNKFQPVGGAYKFDEHEEKILKTDFEAFEDGNISQDEFTHRDYRLNVPVKNLKKFVKRFNETSHRENLPDLSREFIEELVETDVLKFDKIKYRYCGRHFTNIERSRHFKCYELLMADIVELELDDNQLTMIRKLINNDDNYYRFVDVDEIETCGIIRGTEKLLEVIGDHSFKMLEKNESELQKSKMVGEEFTVKIL